MLTVAVVSFIASPLVPTVLAAEENNADYNIKPLLPENQLDRGRSFFDLRVKPGEKQTIKVQIENYSDEEQDYFISVNTAETNGNLIIDYNRKKVAKDTINPLPISNYVKYPKKVTIPAKKAGVVSIDLSVPKEAFDGILLGGIHVKKDFSEEEKDNNHAIMSEYDYVLGLMLSENDKEVTPNLLLNKVTPEVISNNAGLTVELKNDQAINIKNVKMVSHVYAEGDKKKAIISREITDGGIAPMSVFKVNLFNGEAGDTKPLEAGNYEMEMTVTDGADHKWTFNKKFTISKKEAQAVNKEVFTVKSDNTLFYIVIGILLAVLLAVILFLIILLKKRNKKEKEA